MHQGRRQAQPLPTRHQSPKVGQRRDGGEIREELPPDLEVAGGAGEFHLPPVEVVHRVIARGQE